MHMLDKVRAVLQVLMLIAFEMLHADADADSDSDSDSEPILEPTKDSDCESDSNDEVKSKRD